MHVLCFSFLFLKAIHSSLGFNNGLTVSRDLLLHELVAFDSANTILIRTLMAIEYGFGKLRNIHAVHIFACLKYECILFTLVAITIARTASIFAKSQELGATIQRAQQRQDTRRDVSKVFVDASETLSAILNRSVANFSRLI